MVYKYVNKQLPLDENAYTSNYQNLKIDKVITKPFVREGMIYHERTLSTLLNSVQSGDTVITLSLACFSMVHMRMINTLNDMLIKNVRVISILEDYDSDKYKDKTWLDQYTWLKKYDQTICMVIRERRNKGIERAKKEGKFKGHNTAHIEDFSEFEELYKLVKENKMTKIKMAETLNISRPTLDKLFKQQQEKENSNT